MFIINTLALPKYDHGAHNNNRYPTIYVISCVGEKTGGALQTINDLVRLSPALL